MAMWFGGGAMSQMTPADIAGDIAEALCDGASGPWECHGGDVAMLRDAAHLPPRHSHGPEAK